MRLWWTALLLAMHPAPAPHPEPSAAKTLWSIGADDCVSVSADGEPWQMCGFQDYDMNAEGSRVLTASTGGIVELWDGGGRRLQRIEWPDEPGGASGYPDAHVRIVGALGVAVVHQNQLLILDLADGKVLGRRILAEMMAVRELKRVGGDRLFADVWEPDWRGGAREIVLPGGELRAVDDNGLSRVGASYWVTGAPGAIVVHRLAGPDIASKTPCMPASERYCVWRAIPGRTAEVLDVAQGAWRRYDLGAQLGQFDEVRFVALGDTVHAVICGRAPSWSEPRPCTIRDLAGGRSIYSFKANYVRELVGVDESGRPEIRMEIGTGFQKREHRRVSLDGTMRVIDAAGRANLDPPGGGLILPADGDTSMLLDRRGVAVARLPFPAQLCGNAPGWMAYCRVSADGRRWLIPTNGFAGTATADRKLGLTLIALP